MSPAGFESTISAGERPHTHALGRAATGTDAFIDYENEIVSSVILTLVLNISLTFEWLKNIKVNEIVLVP